MDGFDSDKANSSEDEITVLERVTIEREISMEITALIETVDSKQVKTETSEYLEVVTNEISVTSSGFPFNTCPAGEWPYSQSQPTQESRLIIESITFMASPTPTVGSTNSELSKREKAHQNNKFQAIKETLKTNGEWNWTLKDLERANGNLWGKAYLDSLKTGSVEGTYPSSKFGYMYNEIFAQLEAQKTGELSLTLIFDESIEFDQTTIDSGPCWACKLSPAKQTPNCYGPQNIAWLTENNRGY
jgi:hypothetical protein